MQKMSDKLKYEDKLGAVLLQVQDDLRKLKCSLEKIIVNEGDETLDIQPLDNAIRKTESSIRKHAEDYLKAVTEQVLVLPSIEDLPKKTVQIPKWKPSLERFPDVHPQREDLPGSLPGEKHQSQLAMRLLCNPAHPNNRDILYQKCGISLPDVHKRSTNAVHQHHRIITGPTVKPKGCHSLAIPEEDMGTVPGKSLLCMSIKTASLHPREDTYSSKIDSKSRCLKQLKLETEPRSTPLMTTMTPPPTRISKSIDHGSMMQGTSDLIPKSPENLLVPVPVIIGKYPFTITKGRINPVAADFCHFKQSFSLCWSSVVYALEALEKLLRDFAVPVAKVSGERLVEFAHGWDNGWRKAPPVFSLLSVLENWEEVLGLVLRPGQRYKGEGGNEAAAIHIQSCWRRYVARTAYLRHCRRKWAAGTIAISWLMHAQMRRVRKALQARRVRQLENFRSRAQHLAAN